MIGDLSERITIESQQSISDGMGGLAEQEWVTFKNVWAKVEPMSANQVLWAQHLEHRVTHKITIRFLDGLKSDMRVKFKGRYLQIKGIRDLIEKNKFMELSCEEGAAA